MSRMTERTLENHFRINTQSIIINEPVDGSDHLFKLTNDDEYTVNYIHQLINSGFISLTEPIYCIYRIDHDGVENEIFAAGSQEGFQDDDLSEVPTEKPTNKEICTWTEGETKMLLDTYEQFMSKVGPMKRFKTKKHMWISIAEIINRKFIVSKTGIQCENRYKTVLKRKKVSVDNNHKSGNSREPIPFENELNKIASIDDSIEPEVIGTCHGIRVVKRKTQLSCSENISFKSPLSSSQFEEVNKENHINTPSTSCTPKRKKALTVQETLMEIFEKKEEKRERRHREKLELIREIFGKNNQENEN